MATGAAIELDGEYRQLREEESLVRRPSLGALAVTGPDAVDFLQGQLTSDVEALGGGEGSYSALLDRKGHVQSDARVLLVDSDFVWLLAESEGLERLGRHLRTYLIGRAVEVEPLELGVLSLIGPGAGRAAGIEPPHGEHAHQPAAVAEGARTVATDLGFDLLVPAGDLDGVAGELAAGGVPEASEEAAEILRVESGRPRLGREMTPETMPAELGITDRAVSFTKGCYIGQETVARLHYRGRPNRHLRGLRLDGAAADGESIHLGDREVGTVGTAALSPALGPIALAVLRREAEPGMAVSLPNARAAEVVGLPFS